MGRVIRYGNVLGLSLLLLLTACGKKDDVILKEELPFIHLAGLTDEPGFGDNDEEPVDTPFKLPAGLKLVSRPTHPFDPDLKKLYGNMNTFYVDINIVADSKWAGGTVIFPEGLALLNIAPSRIQNGMLMDREPVTLPPYGNNGGNDTTTIYLGVACMNEGRGLPWEDNSEPDVRDYPIGKNMHVPSVITTNVSVLKFLSLLEQKTHLQLTRHYNPRDAYNPNHEIPKWMEPYSVIQTMFWKLTDEGGLQESYMREILEALKK